MSPHGPPRATRAFPQHQTSENWEAFKNVQDVWRPAGGTPGTPGYTPGGEENFQQHKGPGEAPGEVYIILITFFDRPLLGIRA